MEQLRQLEDYESDKIFNIVNDRILWMNQNGIHHWNDYDYTKLYPKSYYAEMCRAGHGYILENSDNKTVLAAAVILEMDERWPNAESESAFYIHNFASSLNSKGAGKRFIRAIEDLAKKHSKEYVRLDVLKDYKILQDYYESLGYKISGECSDGNYFGVLREKRITE